MFSKQREEELARKQKLEASASEKKVEIVTTKPGNALHFPKRGDSCSIHYTGSLESGEMFDNSYRRGQPLIFRLGSDHVIAGIDMTVAKMSKGQKCKVKIHSDFAYGEHGHPPIIPPRATLIYEVELVSFSTEGTIVSMIRDKKEEAGI